LSSSPELGREAALQVADLSGNAGSFHAESTGRKTFFQLSSLGLQDAKLVGDDSELFVDPSIPFDFGHVGPVVALGEGLLEDVIGGGGTDEEVGEP
jgi:hypothetical protein